MNYYLKFTLIFFQVETLKSKLDEANGDILALRKQMQKGLASEEYNGNKILSTSKTDYEQSVQELEKIKKKVFHTYVLKIKIDKILNNKLLAKGDSLASEIP